LKDHRTLWQSQKTNVQQLSVEEVEARAKTLDRAVRWRNWREYAAGVLVIASFSRLALILTEPLMRIGSGLIIAATIFIMIQLRQRSSSDDAGDKGLDIVSGYRSRIAQERDLLRSVPLWYVAPLLPGFVLIVAGKARTMTMPPSLLWLMLNIILPVLVLTAVSLFNLRGANRLQRQLDVLGNDELR
jgi:hypothetical protein